MNAIPRPWIHWQLDLTTRVQEYFLTLMKAMIIISVHVMLTFRNVFLNCLPLHVITVSHGSPNWLMIAFIIWNSTLVPLLEGLCSSNPCRFEFSVFWVYPETNWRPRHWQSGALTNWASLVSSQSKLGILDRVLGKFWNHYHPQSMNGNYPYSESGRVTVIRG